MGITFTFIRHAECEANLKEDLIAGRSNSSPLTLKGRNQAKLLGEYFAKKAIVFDYAFCSTAERAQQTAKCCFEAMQSQILVISCEDLLEQSQGDWEGKVRQPIYQREEVQNNFRYNNWKFIPGDNEKGESQKQVGKRMVRWVNQIVADYHNEREINIIAFTHSNAIKYLLATLFKNDPKWQRFEPSLEKSKLVNEKTPKLCNAFKQEINNTSLTQIRYENRKCHMINCNETPHLEHNKAAL